MENLSPVVLVDKSGSPEQLIQNIHFAVAQGVKGILALACAMDGYDTDAVNTVLRELPVPVCGGLFPQVVYGADLLSQGSIVCGFFQEIQTCVIEGLSDDNSDFQSQMASLAATTKPDASLLVFVDGLSSRIAYFLEECFGMFGSHCQYLGGGTGSTSKEMLPSVFTNRGVKQDCAQLAVIAQPMATSVEHGWSKIAGPFLVTSASNNIIHTLDYRPAFDAYTEAIRESTGERITRENFSTRAHEHPFGMNRIDSPLVVREPLKVKGDSVVCVGEVPQNQLVYILYGNIPSLINASKKAAEELLHVKHYDRRFPALIFDCITRALFLQQHFQHELRGIDTTLSARGQAIGALTLGEIACAGNTCLEFFNKSIVLGVFREQEPHVI